MPLTEWIGWSFCASRGTLGSLVADIFGYGEQIMQGTAKRIGIIGFGGIGQSIVEALGARPLDGYCLAALLVRPYQVAEARNAVAADVTVTADLADFLAANLDIVVEAAGQAAVRDFAATVLDRGCELAVISTGALADAGLHARLLKTAEAAGGRLVIPVGAIAGLDGLLAMRQDGLARVTYTSTKPPEAWKGTPAEARFDLDRLDQSTVIFSGRADEAASQYPKNANLAATVALAGLGFEKTEIRLVADPAATGNTGRIDAESVSSSLTVIVAGRSSKTNPKTSAITGMSVLSSLANRTGLLRFG